MNHWKRFWFALCGLGGVLAFGTVGYMFLGFTLLEALYQSVTTVSTVGFSEVKPLDSSGQIFTIVLILSGVGATFFAFSVLVETFIEGRINELFGRRRMDRSIASLDQHIIICGWGRVGRSIAQELADAHRQFVVIEPNTEKLRECRYQAVTGDASNDEVLKKAGVERAAVLVAAADSDASNSFIILSAREMNPNLFIVSRARGHDSLEKLRRAGANRVVNPQEIGGARMAAFVLRPNVSEFLDVVMHEPDIEFRLEEVEVPADSRVAGKTLRDSHLRDETGALVLALRQRDGSFQTNPSPDTLVQVGHVMIAIGTEAELAALQKFVEA